MNDGEQKFKLRKVEADQSKESRQEDDCTRVMVTVLRLTATTWCRKWKSNPNKQADE